MFYFSHIQKLFNRQNRSPALNHRHETRVLTFHADDFHLSHPGGVRQMHFPPRLQVVIQSYRPGGFMYSISVHSIAGYV